MLSIVGAMVLLAASSADAWSAPAPSETADIGAALTAWHHFPAQAVERPLVLNRGGDVNAPMFGFPDDATKNAFEDGAIEDPTTWPSSPTSADGYPLVSPQDALTRLRNDATPGPASTTRLTVTTVTLGTGLFPTDRGQMPLPAWLFRFENVANPAQVLAVSPRRLFVAPPQEFPPEDSRTENAQVGNATLAPNQKTLVLQFAGAPMGAGACTARYSVTIGASSVAVAVQVHIFPHYGGELTTCSAVAYAIRLTTKLRKPLGNRVLVDAPTRSVVTVTQSPSPAGET